MSVESRPEQLSHPDPSPEVVQEMSLGVTLYRVVDDLFTHQAIAERLGSIAGDPEVEALLDTWKQQLTAELAETANRTVENVVGLIDFLGSAGATVSISSEERQEWERKVEWHKPFTVASICREDLRQFLSEEEIGTLDDSDMEDIAERMSDAYRDSGGYWESLEIMTQHVLGKREGDDQPAPGKSIEGEDQSTPVSPEPDNQLPTEAKAPNNHTPPPGKIE